MVLADVLNLAALCLGIFGALVILVGKRRLAPRAIVAGFALGYVPVYALALLYLIATGAESLLPVVAQSKTPLAVICIFAFFTAVSDFVERWSEPG